MCLFQPITRLFKRCLSSNSTPPDLEDDKVICLQSLYSSCFVVPQLNMEVEVPTNQMIVFNRIDLLIIGKILALSSSTSSETETMQVH